MIDTPTNGFPVGMKHISTKSNRSTEARLIHRLSFKKCQEILIIFIKVTDVFLLKLPTEALLVVQESCK